jgi:hypothetical protein
MPEQRKCERCWTLVLTKKLLTGSIFSNLEYKVFCRLYRHCRRRPYMMILTSSVPENLPCSFLASDLHQGLNVWPQDPLQSVSTLIMCNSCNLHVLCLIIQRSCPNSCHFAYLSDHFSLDKNPNASPSHSFLVPLQLIVLCFCNWCEKSGRGMMMRQIHWPLVEWISSLSTLKHPVGYYTQNMKQNKASDCRPCQFFAKAYIKRVEVYLISSLVVDVWASVIATWKLDSLFLGYLQTTCWKLKQCMRSYARMSILDLSSKTQALYWGWNSKRIQVLYPYEPENLLALTLQLTSCRQWSSWCFQGGHWGPMWIHTSVFEYWSSSFFCALRYCWFRNLNHVIIRLFLNSIQVDFKVSNGELNFYQDISEFMKFFLVLLHLFSKETKVSPDPILKLDAVVKLSTTTIERGWSQLGVNSS